MFPPRPQGDVNRFGLIRGDNDRLLSQNGIIERADYNLMLARCQNDGFGKIFDRFSVYENDGSGRCMFQDDGESSRWLPSEELVSRYTRDQEKSKKDDIDKPMPRVVVRSLRGDAPVDWLGENLLRGAWFGCGELHAREIDGGSRRFDFRGEFQVVCLFALCVEKTRSCRRHFVEQAFGKFDMLS